MQSNINTSRVGIEIGAPVEEGKEKSSIKLNVNFGKASAEAQLSETKALIGGAEIGLSALISIVAAPGKQQELAEVIEDIFSGKGPKQISKNVQEAELAGFVSHRVFQADGNRVIVQIKPGAMTEDMVTTQVTGVVQGFGIEAAASNEKSAFSVTATAGVDFHDALEGHKTNLPTLATFGKSFKLEILASAPAESLLDQKVWEILSQFQPGSPLELLKLLKTVDIDLTFRGIDELPADLQRRLKVDKPLEKFPQTPKSREGTEEHIFFKKVVELIEPQIDVYATLENVAAVHASIRLPGFGKAFVTTHD